MVAKVAAEEGSLLPDSTHDHQYCRYSIHS